MKKESLNLQQSTAVKELGFNEPCFGFYNPNNKERDDSYVYGFEGGLPLHDWNDDEYNVISVPLKSQFFRWVRERYGLRARNYRFMNLTRGFSEGFEIFMYEKDSIAKVESLTYEQAEDDCIDKIIEILKSK